MSDIKKTLGIEDNNEQVVEQKEIDTKQEVSNNEVVEQDVQGNIVNQSFIENEAITNAEEIFKPEVQEQSVEPSFNIEDEEDIKLKQAEIDEVNFENKRTESNLQDYFQAQNYAGMSYYHPELRLSKSGYYGGVDYNNEEWKAHYEAADDATKIKMKGALSTEHSIKIKQARDIISESNKRIANDSFLVQLGMGTAAGLATPTTAIPVGTLLNIAKVSKTANTIYRTTKSGLIVGASGGLAAGIDELMLEKQGYQADPMSAVGWGFALTAPLGMLSGALSGPLAKSASRSLVRERDTFTKDFDTDPHVETRVDEEGNVQLINTDKERYVLAEDETGATRKYDREEIITIKEKAKEGSPEHIEALKKYNKDLEEFKARKGKMTPEEITSLKIPKKLLKADPKFFGKKIEWSNDITKVFYTALSKGGQKYKALEYIDKNFNIPNEVAEDIFNKMKAIASREDEPVIDIFDIEPDIAQYSRNRRKFKEFELPEKEVTMTRGEFLDKNEIKQTELQDLGKMDESKFDKIPLLGDLFKSDIHKGYQSENQTIRKFIGKIAPATVALKDSLGNLIPVKFTGMDYKRKLMGKYNEMEHGVEEAFYQAREEGFKGSLETFKSEVYKSYVNKVAKFENDAYAYANNKVANKEGRKQYLDEFYDNNEIKLGDNGVGKAELAYQKYFKHMLEEGKRLGIKELQEVNVNKPYIPRMYDAERIKRGLIKPKEVKKILKEAITSHRGNERMSKEELDAIVEDLHKYMLEKNMDMDLEFGSYLVSNKIPFATHLKGRKILLDDSKMQGLLVNNFEDIVGIYHYRMSGRMASQFAFGTDKLNDIMKIVKDEAIEKGEVLDPKDIKALENSIRDMLGDLRINEKSNTLAWTFTRNLLTYNSLRMGGNFGGNQVIEMMMAATWIGFNNLMKGRIGRSFKSNASLLFKQGKDLDQFSKTLMYSGYLSNSLHVSRVNRFADTELGFNSGKLEHGLNKANDFLMKYNGLRFFVSTMEDIIGGSVLERIKTGNVTPEMKARWGLTEREFRSLQSDVKKYVNDESIQLEKFSQENKDLFQLAITRGIDEMVIQGDSIHLPSWMKVPSAATKIIFQFMRFPMLAQEILLRRGLAEEQTKFIGGIVSSVLTYSMLKYLREEASYQLGFVEDHKRRYDFINNPDHLSRALLESFNYVAPLGFGTALYNYGAITLGQPELGREWTSGNRMDLLGATASLPEDLGEIITAAFTGDITDERTLQRIKSLSPGLNTGVISEGIKTLLKELGD